MGVGGVGGGTADGVWIGSVSAGKSCAVKANIGIPFDKPTPLSIDGVTILFLIEKSAVQEKTCTALLRLFSFVLYISADCLL